MIRMESKVDGLASDLGSLKDDFSEHKESMVTEIAQIKVQMSWRVKLLMALTGLIGAIATGLLGSCSSPAYAAETRASATAPIRVAYQPEVADITLDAMDYWNEAIGCRVFVKARKTADLRVVRMPASLFLAGYYDADDRRVALFQNVLDDEVQGYFTAIHELGHVLGLRHVEDKMDVMNPSIVKLGGFDQYANRPSSRRHLSSLRERYCE
jgi:predicted Zn-dependent protease